ncbi:hypothetical protein PHISCL_01699 [Aspergillus sclerotialis]|uniref:Uncharacterized protein n=1 Tax=Aspergillus sclerotialis TaxID=2070753 RepID=A0A3A2ZT68_9EURO|nr:hypothetical protein PHISCL_01699 [Aspergillus sclerotialis]
MAEPEEIEEDLFADLYDADETTNQPTSGSEVPKPSDPTASNTPSQPAGAPLSQSVEYPQFETQESHDTYQTPVDGGSQQNGGGHLDLGNSMETPGVQSETQGTGIKEDG